MLWVEGRRSKVVGRGVERVEGVMQVTHEFRLQRNQRVVPIFS